MSEEINANVARYTAAAHAMQSGVEMEIQLTGEAGAGANPKYLRVGVNTALVDAGALVGLLVAKGVFTNEEYAKAIADAMEAEKARYEASIREKMGGANVSLV